MDTDDPRKLTEGEIISLAKTLNRPVPSSLKEELMARIDAIDRSKAATPDSTPDAEVGDEPEP